MSLDAISGYGTDWWTSQMSGQAAVARRSAGQEGQGADAGRPGAANQAGEGESFHVTLSGQAPKNVTPPDEAQQAQDINRKVNRKASRMRRKRPMNPPARTSASKMASR